MLRDGASMKCPRLVTACQMLDQNVTWGIWIAVALRGCNWSAAVFEWLIHCIVTRRSIDFRVHTGHKLWPPK